jgi:signal transduction histidine kinase
MASKVKYPIRLKLILAMSGLVVCATAAYLALATGIFREDKRALVTELNVSAVKTLAAEVDATLSKYDDKIRLLSQGHRDADWTRAVFGSDPTLVSFGLYRLDPETNDWVRVAFVQNDSYLKLYGLDSGAIDRIRKVAPIPFSETLAHGSVLRNSTTQAGAPLATYAVEVQVQGEAKPYVAVADIRLDGLLKRVERDGIATLSIIDDQGRVIANPDTELVQSRSVLPDSPIAEYALSSDLKLQSRTFESNGKRWLAAFSPVGKGSAVVISQVQEGEAFRAMRRLLEKSILFATIVITASILIGRWLASGFTRPIERLSEATARMAQWQFGESVHVDTHDEIAELAHSFNRMAIDLQRQHHELESSHAELERKVRERTAALEGEKKRAAESQDALLRTTRLASLGELAGAATHEILNPLNNMNFRIEKLKTSSGSRMAEDLQLASTIVEGWKKAYADGGIEKLREELQKPVDGGKMLIEEDLENLAAIVADEVSRLRTRGEDLEFLSRELTRITRIVNNMRSLSRVGGERRPLDVHQPIEDTALALGEFLQKRNVELVREFSAETRERFAVTADRDELVQVFSNLIRNAAQAVHQAGRRAGEIRIGTRRESGRVEIRISDNGVGIRQEHLAQVFEPSFTTKSLEEGTGLGLSISRRLVRAFGGDIELEQSREGVGTTFLIWMPATATADSDDNQDGVQNG